MMTEQQYNFALLPPSSTYSAYQSYAREMFQEVHGPYILGNTSLPHITLCQFRCADPKLLITIQEASTSLDFPPYFPVFSGLSIASDPNFLGLFWVGLMVIREETLVKMHQKIKNMLADHGLDCRNSHGERYRPHLTLANAYLKFPMTLPKWPQHLLGESDQAFLLTLGKSDNWGQFRKD